MSSFSRKVLQFDEVYPTDSSTEESVLSSKLINALYCMEADINAWAAALYRGSNADIEMANLWSLFQKMLWSYCSTLTSDVSMIPSVDCEPPTDCGHELFNPLISATNWDGWTNPTSSLHECATSKIELITAKTIRKRRNINNLFCSKLLRKHVEFQINRNSVCLCWINKY